MKESSCFEFLSNTYAQSGASEDADAVKKSGLVVCVLMLLLEGWKVGALYVG